MSADEAIDRVVELLETYEQQFNIPSELPEKGDPFDPVRRRLNAVTKMAREYRNRSLTYQKRVEGLLQVLLRYALFDFSVKAEVTEAGDEIDAIALGLNTVAEELMAAREMERRQIELIREKSEQVEVILSNAPSAVIVIDQEDKVVRWNARAEHMFGYSQEEAMGQTIDSLIIPEELGEAHRKGFAHYLATGEGPLLNRLIEVTARRKDGSRFPAELGISAVGAGGRQFFIGFMNDISQRRLADEQIRSTNVQLENSNRELESFSYSVSHDLRAPLRAIHGYTQILMKEYEPQLDDRGRQMMNSVLSNVKRMGQLIDDLLALSRFGRAELNPQQTDMNRLVANVIGDVKKQPEMARVEFVTHPLPPARVDPTLIVQVMVNLVSNAVKYSSKVERPRIEIGSESQDGETVYYVKDNGSGFDMQFYGKLFGVFQRLHDSAEFEGTGVGLAIVKRIIERHHGRIWAKAAPGAGATFYFTIGRN